MAPDDAAAGWYPDPAVEAPQRYWNGARWTGFTRAGDRIEWLRPDRRVRSSAPPNAPNPPNAGDAAGGDDAPGSDAAGPALVYPSAFTPALVRRIDAGGSGGPDPDEEPGLFEAWTYLLDRWPDTRTPIDGGRMGIRTLDEQRMRSFLARHGAAASRRARSPGVNAGLLPATWIATPGALYYVTTALETTSRWDWSQLTVEPLRPRGAFSRARITPLPGPALEARISTPCLTNLTVIAHHYGAAEPVT